MLGAFDIPAEVGPGGEFDGVVRLAAATGSLLGTGRHILTADHVVSEGSSSAPTFTVLTPSGATKKITTPILTMHPEGTDDIEVHTLAELAPLTVQGWDIYTGSEEVGQLAELVGYGTTGTGTTGNATDIRDINNPTGTDLNFEVKRLTIEGNPTGGSFSLWLAEPSGQTVVLPYDASTAEIEDAVEQLPGINQVQVRLVGDTNPFDDGVIDNPGNPYAGSFEILFKGVSDPGLEVPQMFAQSSLIGGTNPSVSVETILEGGSSRAKRMGRNWIGDVDDTGTRLRADFDDGTDVANTIGVGTDGLGQGANEAFYAAGDSGAPVLTNGQIAGVHKGREGLGVDGTSQTSDFGEIDRYVRVSIYQDFVNDILDDPFDLVLNMENQPWGDDGIDDTIEVSRFINTLQICISGVLYYSESMSLIESVTVFGSDDNETIIVSALGDGVPVQVAGGDGDDVIRLDGLSDALATLVGDGDADTIVIGNGDIPSNIEGTVSVFGGDSIGSDPIDTLVLDDQQSSGDYNYRLEGNTFTMSSFPGLISHSAVEEVHLFANADDNTIRIPSTAFGTSVSVSANSGDDTFRFGGGDIDTNIAGDVELHGGFGDDVLVLLDANDASGGDTHTLGATTYSKTGYPDTLTFHFIREVRLRTGATSETVDVLGTAADVTRLLFETGNKADIVRIHATHANTMTDIRTGRGNDRVELTPTGGDLDAIGGFVVVDGGGGNADALLLVDNNDDGNDPYTVTATSVVKPEFQVDYARVESLTLSANPFANVIAVESVGANTQVTVDAGDGLDTIHVAPGSRQLAGVQGTVHVNGGNGADSVVVHDEENPSAAAALTVQDDLVTRPGFELQHENVAELVVLLGAPSDTVDIPSTMPGMHVVVNTGVGGDSVSANVPTAAQLTFDGNTGFDSVALTGTAADDALSVSTGFGVADVNLLRVEDAAIDLLGGTDSLRYESVAGIDDNVEVHASITAASGLLRIVGLLDLVFENTEILDLFANSGDADTAAFLGTAQADEFAINLSAAGTAIDPVLQLFDAQSLALLLTLRDYRNFGTLGIQGGDGVDVFNVHVAPAGPGVGRNLQIDGGEPAGGGDGKDELNVFFETPAPDIDHDHDNQANSGTFDIQYELKQFFIEYFNMEKAVAKSANAA